MSFQDIRSIFKEVRGLSANVSAQVELFDSRELTCADFFFFLFGISITCADTYTTFHSSQSGRNLLPGSRLSTVFHRSESRLLSSGGRVK